MTPTLFLLHGYPGTGKLTVARQMLALMDPSTTRIVDNHYVNNPIFNLLPVDGRTPQPREAWDRIADVRSAMVRTIEDLSPRDWSFIFTNHLADDEEDREWALRLEHVAEARRNRFVPVRMDCSLEELVARVTRPDRSERMKMVDPDWIRENYDPSRLLDLDHPNQIRVDTTDTPADETARVILDRARAAR